MKARLTFMNQKFKDEAVEFFAETALKAYAQALQYIEEHKGVRGLRRVYGIKLLEI